ncbi:alpha-(1,3)-fucosyltransferase 7 isoform X2 [Scyliorhinus canicula]|uniref:alpha-(1,3)-fucosyltransferase 7 isoform X2 n=1 Tax=Scyliorhinus canicula TaxID=7830 RepID=UPI0018F4C979|nr:alpha-(1,3)-fucosyltransferase 7 isoform X2 [Scyliorhinus canicula]
MWPFSPLRRPTDLDCFFAVQSERQLTSRSHAADVCTKKIATGFRLQFLSNRWQEQHMAPLHVYLGATFKTGRILALLLVTGYFMQLVTNCYISLEFWPARNSAKVQEPLVVLVWHWPFHPDFAPREDVCLELYAIDNCILTSNRSRYDRADVVVFHHRELQIKTSNLPQQTRPPNQKWLWVSLESPTNTKRIHQLNGCFNWTMTYKADSDIFLPYGTLMPSDRPPNFSISKKSGLSTWVVSNYRKTSLRAKLHANLSKHMTIDLYGRAAGKFLPSEMLLPTISRYAFYLAFENSIHKDYITEKIWRNAFMAGSVPVVLGPPRANYEEFIPADSFIHVDDFASAGELTTFLMGLWKNSTRYEQYFNWRRTHVVKMSTNWTERLCNICTKFPILPQSKIYHNLHDWFHQ